eukprot:16617-Chlamydomonas_euryale.AAC.1
MPLLDNRVLQMGVSQGQRTVRLSRADREADSSLMAILGHLPGIRTIADLVVLDCTTRNVDGWIGKAFVLRDHQHLLDDPRFRPAGISDAFWRTCQCAAQVGTALRTMPPAHARC